MEKRYLIIDTSNKGKIKIDLDYKRSINYLKRNLKNNLFRMIMKNNDKAFLYCSHDKKHDCKSRFRLKKKTDSDYYSIYYSKAHNQSCHTCLRLWANRIRNRIVTNKKNYNFQETILKLKKKTFRLDEVDKEVVNLITEVFVSYNEEDVKHMLTRKNNDVYVLINNRLIKSVMILSKYENSKILEIAILSSYEKKSYAGEILLSFAKRIKKRRNYKKLVLYSDINAVEYYKERGFKLVTEEKEQIDLELIIGKSIGSKMMELI